MKKLATGCLALVLAAIISSCAVPGNVLGAAGRVTSRALHLAPTAAAAAGGL